MDKKEQNLPIRLFHKRDIDTRETEGGGNNKPRKWFLYGEDLLNHASEISDEIELLQTSE